VLARFFAGGGAPATGVFSFVGGRRDSWAHFCGRLEGCVCHGERGEDFAQAEAVERFAGYAFEGDAEDDESDVAVFGADGGICG
jgi:hypothetical protein